MHKQNELYDHMIEKECRLKLEHAFHLHNAKQEQEFEEFQNDHRHCSMPEDLELKLLYALNEEKAHFKKKQRSAHRRRLVKIAAILIAFLGISGALLVNNVEAFRYKFNSFIEEIRTDYFKLTPADDSESSKDDTVLNNVEDLHGVWYPEYLPEGFAFASFEDHGPQLYILFLSHEGTRIIFSQNPIADGYVLLRDGETDSWGEIEIGGRYTGFWLEKDEKIFLKWIHNDNLMSLTSFTQPSIDELKKMAESLTYLK